MMFRHDKVFFRSVKRWIILSVFLCIAPVYYFSTYTKPSQRQPGQVITVAKYLPPVSNDRVMQSRENNTIPKDTHVSAPSGIIRRVLFWTPFFRAPDPRGNMAAALFEGCPVNHCFATNNKSALKMADAVIFHAFDIDLEFLPGPRRSRQHYAFHIGESPPYSQALPKVPAGYFDMTISYRLDSDILGHYSYSVPLERPPKNFSYGKSKLVAWFVSNCNTDSRRENYAKELGKHIQLDIYGHCGTLKCPRHDERACDEMLRKDYKFYLSFENSICLDYVTEKFTRALSNYVVPIVMGAGNMTIFPPGSYIHVDDFPSIKALSELLTYLDANDTAYNDYMKWRFDPELTASHGRYSPTKSSWCQLCEKLHDASFRPQPYPDVLRWHIDGGHCRKAEW